ncbi:MAG: hypothetical protein ACRD8Z_15755, partial [Nitrososphaeraceae archaeon]
MNHNISITIPQKVVEKIDKDRGDINRSRYILRLLERAYENLAKESTDIQKIVRRMNTLLLELQECLIGITLKEHNYQTS